MANGRSEEKALSPEEIKRRNDLQKRDTDHKIYDKIYNALVDRYTKKKHLWLTSDTVIWRGAVYEVPTMVSYILWFVIFMFLAKGMLKRYGDAYTIIFFILFLTWRVQLGVRALNQLNKKL